jgi:hypothetical protein
MILSHKYKFAYFAIPKTASETLTSILIDEYNAEFWNGGDKHENVIPEQFYDYFCFTSIRHPYQRVLSAYQYINRKNEIPLSLYNCRNRFHLISMTQYLNKPLIIRRWATIKDNVSDFEKELPAGYLLPRIDQYIKVETLQEDFNRLPFINKTHKLEKLNSSKPKHLLEQQTIIEFTHQFQGDDFDLYSNPTPRH